MISFALALALCGTCVVLLLCCIGSFFNVNDDPGLGQFVLELFFAIIVVIMIIGMIASSGAWLPLKYYEIKDVGTTEIPQQVAVVEKKITDITQDFRVVLYNPELYYLEVKEFKGCTHCFVRAEGKTEYRVVPKSLIEVQ